MAVYVCLYGCLCLSLMFVYEVVDRESAYEMLKARAQKLALTAEQEKNKKPAPPSTRSKRHSPLEAMVKSAARSIGSQIGRQIIRGILGSLFGRR